MTRDEIIQNFRSGVLDINNQELFFKTLIKGLLICLNKEVKIRGVSVPHIVLHTGDDYMYLNLKGQNASIEPYEVSNEDYVYNVVPRCIVNLGNIDLLQDQTTNPYSRGIFQYQSEDNLYSLSAECRRTPIKLTIELKYYVDTFTDILELIQHILSKFSYIRSFYIIYCGQGIFCSYKIPEVFGQEHLMEITGSTQDNRCRTINLTLEVETNFPVFSNASVISTDSIIKNLVKPGGDNPEDDPNDPGSGNEDDILNSGAKSSVGIKLYATDRMGVEYPTDYIPYYMFNPDKDDDKENKEETQ